MASRKAVEVLAEIAKYIETGFNGDGVKRVGFVLVTFALGPDGKPLKEDEPPVINYVANVEEKETGLALRSMMDRFGFTVFERRKGLKHDG